MNSEIAMELNPALNRSYPGEQDTTQVKWIRRVQMLKNSEPCFATGKRFYCTEACEWQNQCRESKQS